MDSINITERLWYHVDLRTVHFVRPPFFMFYLFHRGRVNQNNMEEWRSDIFLVSFSALQAQLEGRREFWLDDRIKPAWNLQCTTVFLVPAAVFYLKSYSLNSYCVWMCLSFKSQKKISKISLHSSYNMYDVAERNAWCVWLRLQSRKYSLPFTIIDGSCSDRLCVISQTRIKLQNKVTSLLV